MSSYKYTDRCHRCKQVHLSSLHCVHDGGNGTAGIPAWWDSKRNLHSYWSTEFTRFGEMCVGSICGGSVSRAAVLIVYPKGVVMERVSSQARQLCDRLLDGRNDVIPDVV